jgi:hypothetical protein
MTRTLWLGVRRDADEASRPATMPANVCEQEASPGGVESILIVEDQEAVRNVVAIEVEERD